MVKKSTRFFISKYPNAYGDGNVPVSMPGTIPINGLTKKEVDDCVRKKGAGWKNFSSVEFVALSILSVHRNTSDAFQYTRPMEKMLSGVWDGTNRSTPSVRYKKTGTCHPTCNHDGTQFGVTGLQQERWNWVTGAKVDSNGKYWVGGYKTDDGMEYRLDNSPTWFSSRENMVETPFYANKTTGYSRTKTNIAPTSSDSGINTDDIESSYYRATMYLVGIIPIPGLALKRITRVDIAAVEGDDGILLRGGEQKNYIADLSKNQWDMFTPHMIGLTDYIVLPWHCFRTTYIPELE